MIRTVFALLAPLVLASGALAGGGENWFDDFDEAVAAAREQKKDLFVDFTGSDWCGWCIRLDREVFQHEEFLAPAMEQYVLVALDFPRKQENIAKVPNPRRNEEVKDKYSKWIQGFPTCLLMTADGEVYAKTGYQAGGPKAYVEHLNEIRAEGRKQLDVVDALVTEFEQAPEAEREAAREVLARKLVDAESGNPFIERATQHVRPLLAADPENERGLRLIAAHALVKHGARDSKTMDIVTELDPKNEHGAFEWTVMARMEGVRTKQSALETCDAVLALAEMGPIHDKELERTLLFQCALWANQADRKETAKKLAGMVLALDGNEPEVVEMMKEIAG